jgi:protein subunit release factor B
MGNKKELLFSVTKKDLIFEYFSGTGAGGQHRNKCQNSCRCKHILSGAIGACQEHRSRVQNTKIAFSRMAKSKKFQEWIRVEAARFLGQTAASNNYVDQELSKNVKIEVKKDGRWVEEKAY